ncbi:hypothetical protein ACYA53_09000 [Klebsiella pneumoniae]|uniref:hypothetical protein n=1 Tax=Klebsiella pneumoniae TaxID=573 RepID=UPI001CC14E7A|nr:hypothetical protein [Klebsiella pneumoniae]MBZ2028124.1 hypothetical protein [Klebsiella pneumoniae]
MSEFSRETLLNIIETDHVQCGEASALARMALAAMDSAPVAEVVSIYGDPEAFGEREIRPLVGIQQMPYGTKLYRHVQPAPVVEREPIAWLNDAYLARGVVDGEAGSEDAGPGYIPVYREAGPQPVPVVPDERDKAVDADDHPLLWSFNEGWNACRAAMLHAGNSPAQSDCCPAQNGVDPEQNNVTPAQGGNYLVIPDGYVMVPKEPTKEMIDAGWLYYMATKLPSSKGTYKAMLAAAPQPQNAPQNIPEIIPNELIAAVNRLLDSNGSRGCYNAIKCYDAHIEVERLLAVARQEVNHG